MKVFHKDVSDQEVKSFMAIHYAEMMKHVVPRVKFEPIYQGPGRTKRTKNTTELLTVEERELMEDIVEEPNLNVTARATRLGLSAYKMNDLKGLVLRKGLAVQFSINLGKVWGGNVSLLALTSEGYKALGKKPVEKPKNISWGHFWWQTTIRDYFIRKGGQAEIEKNRNGKRVDVCLTRNGKEVAVEVELSPKNAVTNIAEDLKAGFERVVCCGKNKMVAREVERRLKAYKNYEIIKDRVEVHVLTELELVKELYCK